MKTDLSSSTPLRLLLLNGGDISWLAEAALSNATFEQYAPALEERSLSLPLGDSHGPVALNWLRSEPGNPAEFTLCRGTALLLMAGLAMDPEQGRSLWNRLTWQRRSTFRCLGPARPIPTVPPPWLGLLLMPAAPQLSDDGPDALCATARTTSWDASWVSSLT